MSIDNRIFVIIASPFAFVALLRALFWFAGAEWSEPGIAAIISLSLAYVTAVALFIWEVDLGSTRIGKKGGDA
jgi:hypothetical protein